MNKEKHILFLSSWFPTVEKPFLGNFIEYQAHLLGVHYTISFIRLLPKRILTPTKPLTTSFNYIDVYYRKSKNPIITYFLKRKALRKALQALPEIDFIQGNISYPDGWLFAYAKKIVKKPLVLIEHGSYFAPSMKWSTFMSYTVNRAITAADVLLAVSAFLAKDIEKRTHRKVIKVVGNPVDLELFHPGSLTSDTIQFLHISTLSKIKNFEPVVKAFARVLEKYPNARLKVVSDEDFQSYQTLCKTLNIDFAVDFIGPIEHTAISSYYQQADCFVMNSDYETFSIVIAEAWASGIPVISTPVGIAYKKQINGLLLTDGAVDSVERALLAFIENKGNYQAEMIRKQAEEFSKERFLSEMKVIYEGL